MAETATASISSLTRVTVKRPAVSQIVFVMGVLSGLIASPARLPRRHTVVHCTNWRYDTGFYFSLLSIGMGVPLILFGMTGSSCSKAGNWMNALSYFDFAMLAVAIVFIERLYNSLFAGFLWGLLGFGLLGLLVLSRASKNSHEAVRAVVVAIGIMGS